MNQSTSTGASRARDLDKAPTLAAEDQSSSADNVTPERPAADFPTRTLAKKAALVPLDERTQILSETAREEEDAFNESAEGDKDGEEQEYSNEDEEGEVEQEYADDVAALPTQKLAGALAAESEEKEEKPEQDIGALPTQKLAQPPTQAAAPTWQIERQSTPRPRPTQSPTTSTGRSETSTSTPPMRRPVVAPPTPFIWDERIEQPVPPLPPMRGPVAAPPTPFIWDERIELTSPAVREASSASASSPVQESSTSPASSAPQEPSGPQPLPPARRRKLSRKNILWLAGILLAVAVLGIISPVLAQAAFAHRQTTTRAHVAPKPSPTPKPFDPNVGAILPTHRVVAFYAIPNAEATGPAYQLTSSMLKALQTQGKAYQDLDPAHPVQLGIDLVASIPDGFPGPHGYYSHHLDADTIQSYITFCQQHNLILFLDLNFGLAPIKSEVNFFLPYLERYPFVEMAIDPEWMFPRHDGIPGINLSNVRASDLNPIIETLAELPMKYHVPRKILIIHQYRGDGDGLKNPHDAGLAEIANKRDLVNDPRVDLVIHVDSVGGYNGDQKDKTWQYNTWVGQDMQKYHNFRYGGFKIFYHIEKKTLMHPQQVMALKPPPMVITYGN